MKRFFLYKLFTVSKPWFIFCLFFVLLYFFFFVKKMDSVFTPYNGMFAFVNSDPNKTSTIAIKLNNKLVPYTNNLWWKKDFFENSFAFYSKYILNNKEVLLNNYIKQRSFSISKKEFLYKRLTPDSLKVKAYPLWLIQYADQKPIGNSILEFIKYDFNLLEGNLFLKDSTSLFKIKVSNAALHY